jgi:hypothetical protein
MFLSAASLFAFYKVSQACSGFLLITDFLRVSLSLFLSVLIASHLAVVASIVSSLKLLLWKLSQRLFIKHISQGYLPETRTTRENKKYLSRGDVSSSCKQVQ